MSCYFLNKLGYTNIHLYGDINDAHPKTIIVDDIVNDVTTSYIHNGYNNYILKIIEEYNFNLSKTSRVPFQNNKFTNWNNVNDPFLLLRIY